MPLKLPSGIRFSTGIELDRSALSKFGDMIDKIESQSDAGWSIIEIFKTKFGCDGRSSSRDWARSDLNSAMFSLAQKNGAAFVAAFYDGCEAVAVKYDNVELPDEDAINHVLFKSNFPCEISSGDLKALGSGSDVSVTLSHRDRQANEVRKLTESLDEADRLLAAGRNRQAVQEVLWLIETVSTALVGKDLGGGQVKGKYFNEIIRDLKSRTSDAHLDRALHWMSQLHGYLSAPAGGGVRHGTNLSSDLEITLSDAKLWCNLTRSYIQYILDKATELEVLVQRI